MDVETVGKRIRFTVLPGCVYRIVNIAKTMLGNKNVDNPSRRLTVPLGKRRRHHFRHFSSSVCTARFFTNGVSFPRFRFASYPLESRPKCLTSIRGSSVCPCSSSQQYSLKSRWDGLEIARFVFGTRVWCPLEYYRFEPLRLWAHFK